MNVSVTGYASLLRETRMCSRRQDWLDSTVPPDTEEHLPDTWVDASPWLMALVQVMAAAAFLTAVLMGFLE